MSFLLCLILVGQDARHAPAWKKPQHIGNVEATVVHAAMTPVRFKEGDKTTLTDERFLCIVVSLKSTNGRALPYRSWSLDADGDLPAVVSDDEGNVLDRKYFTDRRPVKSIDSGTIRPDRPLYDILLFGLPERKTRNLRLTLTGSRIGQEEIGTFTIPLNEITQAKGSETLDGQYALEQANKKTPARKRG